ncbi:hypothetical protein CRUP_013105 [Coryphaenoides rupestris]|nr:hypothetical protein CRUP_013105 [Coryphaenoides rupestris]
MSPSPDDVEGKIRKIIPAGFSCNADDFASLLEKEANFRPFGTLLHTYKVDMSCPGFQEYHARLQTFLMWFIETASFIDVDDDHWDFFLVFEKYNKDGETLYATVGYMTVYNYYVYPDKTRPRVRFYCTLPKVQDITAEDPSENYVKLRDFVLAKLCLALPLVYEILRLKSTDMADEAKAREYRLDVKRRLVGPYKKNQRELSKMMKCLRPEELMSHIRHIDTDLQHQELEKSYQEVLDEYRRTLERLAAQA